MAPIYDWGGEELGIYSAGGATWFDQNVPMGGRTLVKYGSTLRILHANNLGTTTVTTDQTGTELQDELFYPWGQDWTRAGQPYVMHFAGMQGFENPGLVYPTDFRRYNPALGRWMAPDPMGGDVTNPQSLNRYPYALNSPTTLTDPSGLYSSNPGGPCSQDWYYYSHAECGGPPPGDCEEYDLGDCSGNPFPPLGGYGGGTGGGATAPPSAPPAGQPPLAGEGSGFIHNPLPCLSDAQKAILAAALRSGAAALLGLQASQLAIVGTSVRGGALNVELAASGGGSLPVTPLAQTLSSPLYDPIFEPGFNTQVRADGVVPVGPGTSYHVVFNTSANAQKQEVITGTIRSHADIGNPATGGTGRHVKGDVLGATIFSVIQGGIPGCAVKFD